MEIRLANPEDLDMLLCYDKHIAREEAEFAAQRGRIWIAREREKLCGWLRYNLFWDNTPFMNMLYILEGARGKGHGKQLTARWEGEMKKQGYKTVMTSTASDEYAQHFYQKLGYRAAGGFLSPGEPFEILFTKTI